jgi:hypothetical protein
VAVAFLNPELEADGNLRTVVKYGEDRQDLREVDGWG